MERTLDEPTLDVTRSHKFAQFQWVQSRVITNGNELKWFGANDEHHECDETEQEEIVAKHGSRETAHVITHERGEFNGRNERKKNRKINIQNGKKNWMSKRVNEWVCGMCLKHIISPALLYMGLLNLNLTESRAMNACAAFFRIQLMFAHDVPAE